jgi:hypothetical protein
LTAGLVVAHVRVLERVDRVRDGESDESRDSGAPTGVGRDGEGADTDRIEQLDPLR